MTDKENLKGLVRLQALLAEFAVEEKKEIKKMKSDFGRGMLIGNSNAYGLAAEWLQEEIKKLK